MFLLSNRLINIVLDETQDKNTKLSFAHINQDNKLYFLSMFYKEHVFEYRNNFSYSDDEIFIYLDFKWQEIISLYMIPAIISIEDDFTKHKLEYISYKNSYNPKSRPTDEEIVLRAKHLYKLLINNKIYKKHYLD